MDVGWGMSNVWAGSVGRFCGRMSGQVWGSVKGEIIDPQTRDREKEKLWPL